MAEVESLVVMAPMAPASVMMATTLRMAVVPLQAPVLVPDEEVLVNLPLEEAG